MSRRKALSIALALAAAALVVDLRPGWFGLPRARAEPTLKSLEPGLASASSARRLEALQSALALSAGGKAGVAARFLGDPSAAVRLEAVRYFEKIHDPLRYFGYDDERLPASVFVKGLYDPEPELAGLFAKQVERRARRDDIPALVSYLDSRRAEWEVPPAEVLVGQTVGRLGRFGSGYTELKLMGTCGNPYIGAVGDVVSRPFWKKLLGPSDAEALNELDLHFDRDDDSDLYRANDPANRRARERVLAWWRRGKKPPLVAPAAPPLRPNPRAFLREHPVETTITRTGEVRYESLGYLTRVVPVTLGAGTRQALYKGAKLRYGNFQGPTEITLTSVSENSAEGEARQDEYPLPLETQRLPVAGQRVSTRERVYDESEEE